MMRPAVGFVVLALSSLDALQLRMPAALRLTPAAANRQFKTVLSSPPCDISTLPGDPSLVLSTNIKMGDAKRSFMVAASKAVSTCLSKPESYVAVCIHDGADVLFGGTDAPAAVGCVYSLGSINQANNAALTKAISELLAEFEIADNRIYINFFDIERANCGWSGRTFAG